MQIVITKDYEAMSRSAAAVIAAQVIAKPDAILGLATGSTPVGLYRNLVAGYAAGDLDFSHITTVNLDEYAGLDGTHDQSYRYFMNHNLFDHVNIDKANTNVPNGKAEDPDAECARYEALLKKLGPADIQLLGMGHNGHIGFNEPGDAFIAPTHVVELTESTINANARFFASRDEVPKKALTMGMGAIMRARRVLVVVSGHDKARAVKDAFAGPITPKCPASILQLHPDVVLVGDEAALSGLLEAGVQV